MRKIGKDWFVVLVNVAVQCIFILIYLIFAITLNAWGIIIGGALGLFVSSLNIILILKGSTSLLSGKVKEVNDSNETSFGKLSYIIFYFVRILVTLGILIMTVLFQFRLNFTAFNFSFIPVIISLTFIIAIIPLGDYLFRKLHKNQIVTEQKPSSNEIEEKVENSEVINPNEEVNSEPLEKNEDHNV